MSNLIDKFKEIIREQAYDRGHAWGIEEVDNLENNLLIDFEPIILGIEELEKSLIEKWEIIDELRNK